MNIFRFLRIFLISIYGFISNAWFGWTIVSPEFWAILTIMVLIGLFSSLEEEYDR